MKKKVLIISLSIVIAVIIILIISAIIWYNVSIGPAKNMETSKIEIEQGMSTEQILDILKEKNIIKNKFSAKIYIKLNKITSLQAGKYEVSSAMPLEKILNKIAKGEILNEEISITFLEGKNIRWVVSKIAEETVNTEEDIYNLLRDKEYLNELINKYWFLTDVILNENIYYSLEGYLYPETYTFKNKEISAKEIFEKMLNQTDKVLSKYKLQITNKGASVHQILTLSSIIELEGKDINSRKGISSVIYNRLKHKMSIGSDVTTYYGLKVDMGERDLYAKEINTYNPYNTRGPNMNGKLPIGPISNVSEESIESALNPDSNEYLFFVADSKGKIYFSKTYEEHQNKIKELQKQGLWYEY